jgi:hypothetical protein
MGPNIAWLVLPSALQGSVMLEVVIQHRFMNMAAEKDLVLIYYEDKPLSFARIEGIEPDHKPNWYHVKLLLLQVPVQTVTWILRDAYIDGAEFTMNGKRMRLEKVKSPEPAAPPQDLPDSGKPHRDPGNAKVIPLAKVKKDK